MLDTPARNLYELLQLSQFASPEVVKASYRSLKRRYTSLGQHQTDLFRSITRAYETLSQPTSRAAYDISIGATVGDISVIGEYRVIEKIGEGGFGQTYKGVHLPTGGWVCIKLSHPVPSTQRANYTALLKNEALAMWDLRHFAIPIVHDFIELADGRCALVTSFIPGLTLEKIVQKLGRIPQKHLVWIVDRILNAFRYFHSCEVIHGDIKPANIIIQRKDHTAAVIDFGLSMINPTADKYNRGYTEFYSPPEQVEGGALLPESDFYSLGMTMIYMLTGSVDCVRQKRIPQNVDVDSRIVGFIQRITKDDILERPRWEQEDLWYSWVDLRIQVYGTAHSNMEPLVV